MYDELISSLRICERINSVNDNCIAFHDGSCEAEPVCMYELMDKAADAIEELLAERDEVNADSWKTAFEVERDEHRWIPVEERLPLYGQDVLAVRTYGDGEKCQEVLMAHVAVWNEETGEKWWNATNITHWMPLPEPPKEERA